MINEFDDEISPRSGPDQDQEEQENGGEQQPMQLRRTYSSTFINLNEEFYNFKNKYSLQKRLNWSSEAREKYPNKLALIVEQDSR